MFSEDRWLRRQEREMIQVRRSDITCLNVVKKDLMTYQKKKKMDMMNRELTKSKDLYS